MWLLINDFNYVFIITITVISSISVDSFLIVKLPKGKIQGHVLTSNKNNSYYAFQQIPYAAPPVGSLRFSEPVEPDSWKGILKTTENTKECYQETDGLTEINAKITEDCLYLNVYTPVAPGKKKNNSLAVMFYIHGGGFTREDGSLQRYGPQFLIDHKVIVVTINYRIGPLGFLYTEDGVIPANRGLKDQNMALRWTKENIALFGGDPEKITIAGESAGASSVGYHVVSKKSAGLFRGAIMQSGSSLCDFAHQRNGNYLAYRLGQYFDPSLTTSNTTQELLQLLRSVPAGDCYKRVITEISDDKVNEYMVGGEGLIWTPVIERANYSNAFITNRTYENLISGNFNQIPILIGFNSEESLLFFSSLNMSGAAVDKNLVWAVGHTLNLNASSAKKAGKLIRSIYTNSTFAEDYPAFVRFGSEKAFVTPILKHAAIQSKYTDVYVYQFSYKGFMAARMNYNTVAGKDVESVTHSEELYYLFTMNNDHRNLSYFPDTDILTLNRMTKMWTNFVKYLNPTPEKDELLDNLKWPTFKSDNMKYVNINETLDIKKNPKNFAILRKIIEKYGVRPFITY